MSRKRLKALDPGNTDKGARDNYNRLLEGSAERDLAPKVRDENRLSGAARRFAFQLQISKQMDRREREQGKGEKGAKGSKGKTDYKSKLAEQIAQAAAAKKLQAQRAQEKAARRQAAKQAAAAGLAPSDDADAPATSPSSPTPSDVDPSAAPASSDPAQPAAPSVVSLSRSRDEQRAAKRARLEQEAEARRKAEEEAEQAEAAAEAADAAASADAEQQSTGSASSSQHVQFDTEMRPGESFRSYQSRLLQEKRARMNAESVSAKGLSERRKRKLAEKDERKRARKDPNAVDARERRAMEERRCKDERDGVAPSSPSSSATATARDFATEAPVAFGEVVERPPTLTVVPRSRSLAPVIERERIIESLVLMQKKKGKKGGSLDEAQKEEWIERQLDVARRSQLALQKKERDLQSLREASVAAYKAAKKRKREEEGTGGAGSGLEGVKPLAYQNKRAAKKAARNRQRMSQFRQDKELEMDAEIEMADDFD